MADRFYPDRYVAGRPLARDQSVELPRALTCLDGDENHSIIVAVDGACRDNGLPAARAALGVFFRQGSRWNRSEVLPRADATSQRAELCAALRALQTVRDFVADEWESSITAGYALRRVIIKSDSTYLVAGMTDWVLKWLRNGFTNARGQPVQNQDLFKALKRCLDDMRDARGIEVQFWLVGREHNWQADGLANAALDTALSTPFWDFRNAPAQQRQEMDKRTSEKVWRWHERMGHIPLHEIQRALGSVRGLDVTYDQIQAEIDRGTKCVACSRFSR